MLLMLSWLSSSVCKESVSALRTHRRRETLSVTSTAVVKDKKKKKRESDIVTICGWTLCFQYFMLLFKKCWCKSCKTQIHILSVNFTRCESHRRGWMCRTLLLFCTKFGKSLGLLVEFFFLFVLRTILLFIKVFYTKVCFVLSFLCEDIGRFYWLLLMKPRAFSRASSA